MNLRRTEPPVGVGGHFYIAAIAGVAWLVATEAIAASQAGQHGTSIQKGPIVFDIPAQPLADALYTYSSVTGVEVLVPADMLLRRKSSAIAGRLNAEDALRVLLSGTGLSARYTGLDALTLVPAAPLVSPKAPRMPDYPQYSAALQAAVMSALCRIRETQPGHYRMAARFWVAKSGAVTRVAILGSSGDADRDRQMTGLLGNLVVGASPPPGLPQPTTILVSPRPEARIDCPSRAGVAP